MAHLVARTTRNLWMPVSREFEHHQRLRRLVEQESLPSLLSTGWFQEPIRAQFTLAKVLVSQSKLN